MRVLVVPRRHYGSSFSRGKGKVRVQSVSSLSVPGPVEPVGAIFPPGHKVFGGGGKTSEAAALLLRVVGVAATASLLWANKSQKNSSFESGTDAQTSDTENNPLELFRSVVEDSHSSIERLWSVFVSLAAARETKSISHTHLSALLKRVSESTSTLAASQALYTLKVMISQQIEPSHADIANVLSACNTTPASIRSILKTLSPSTHKHELLFSVAMDTNRARAAEQVFMDSLDRNTGTSSLLAERLLAHFLSRGMFGRAENVMEQMILSNQWPLECALVKLTNGYLGVRQFDLAVQHLERLATISDTSVSTEFMNTFVNDVLDSLSDISLGVPHVPELLDKWYRDSRISASLKERIHIVREKYSANSVVGRRKALNRHSKLGDELMVHEAIRDWNPLHSDSLTTRGKVLKAASIAGNLDNVKKHMSMHDQLPTQAIASSIIHALGSRNMIDEAAEYAKKKVPMKASAFNRLIANQLKSPQQSSSDALTLIQNAHASGQTLSAATLTVLATSFTDDPSNLSTLPEFLTFLSTSFPNVQLDARFYNKTLTACSKHAQLQHFPLLRAHMEFNEISPDAVTYSILLSNAGSLADMQPLLTEMRDSVASLTNAQSNELMRAACMKGTSLETVLEVWRTLIQQGFTPRDQTVRHALRRLVLRSDTKTRGIADMLALWELLKEEKCGVSEENGAFVARLSQEFYLLTTT